MKTSYTLQELEDPEIFKESCDNLQVNYLDLYLLHWPKKLDKESWKAIVELYLDGKIRAIGVSNYHQHHLCD